MNKFLFGFLSILSISLCSAQEQKETLTLESAISAVLENNFSIQLAKNSTVIADNNNTVGNAGFLPIVDADASYNRSSQNTEQEFASGDTQSRRGAIRTSYGAGVGLTWTLFDGTAMFATKERLENEELRSQYELKFEVDNAIAQLLSSYNQIAFENERLELLESSIEFSEERKRIVEDKYNLGKESKLTLLQAEVDLNADRSALIQQQELIAQLKLLLLQQMAVDPYDFEIEHEIIADSTLQVEELLATSAGNPTLMVQLANQEVLKNQMQEIDRSKWPQIDFNMGYGYNNLESQAGFLALNQTYDFTYGLTARVTLFNGLNQRRQYQNARVQMESGTIQMQQAETQIKTNILATYNTYQNNLQLSLLEEANLAVAEENSEIALERFRLGSSNSLELREAQINLINSQIRYYQALYTTKLAEIELRRLSGTVSQIAQ